MAQRPIRFGVVAAPQGGPRQWRDTARRAEELGYSTLVTPDNLALPAPTVSLAIAASVTTTLRVGTYVLASPLRTPRAAAWDALSLSQLTEGRFELGLGTGLPSMREAAEELGLPYESGAGRLEQVARTIEHVRTLAPEQGPPVLVAAGGPKARALAAAQADIVTLAAPPLTGRAEHTRLCQEVRELAGERAAQLELSLNIFVVGDEVPASVRGFIGADAATLVEHDSLTIVRGDAQQVADELLRRRDQLGITYFVVNGLFMDAMAPVVARLSGR